MRKRVSVLANYRIEPEEYVTSTNGANVELQEYTCAGVAIDMHIHSSIEVLYIVRGRFEVVSNEGSNLLGEGDCILLRKYTAHSVNVLSGDGGAYYVIKIHPSLISDFAATENIPMFNLFFSLDTGENKCVWRKEEIEKGDMHSALTTIARGCGDADVFSFTELKLNAGRLMLAILRAAYAEGESNFEFLKFGDNMMGVIQKAIEYINTHYAENLTTREIAKMLGLSYTYFSGSFSRATGKSFKQYLNQTRINHAKKLLAQTGMAVSRVGEAVGFSSASHFILEFRNRTGMTPFEFSKNIKRS